VKRLHLAQQKNGRSAMNRANMAKQITEAPMKKTVKGYKKGGCAAKGMKKGGKVEMDKISPRKRMAMGKK